MKHSHILSYKPEIVIQIFMCVYQRERERGGGGGGGGGRETDRQTDREERERREEGQRGRECCWRLGTWCPSNILAYLRDRPARLYLLPNWDRSCRSNLLPYPVLVFEHWTNQSKPWHGVTVSTFAFLACHQCYCTGSSLTWGLNLWALVCGIFWSLLSGVFSGYSGFLPSFIG